MDSKQKFVIVDRDAGRRAQLSFLLQSQAYHTEPCEDISEYRLDLPRNGKIIAYDDKSSLEAIIQTMRSQGTWMSIIVYSENPKPGRVVDTIRLGATDYIGWPIDRKELTSRLIKTELHSLSEIDSRVRGARAGKQLESLTKRELEVLDSLKHGNSNRDIARELSISPRTVEIHRANMMKKIGAKSQADAVRIAMEAGDLSVKLQK